MYRFKKGIPVSDIGTWDQPQTSNKIRCRVRQNVTKDVGRHNDIIRSRVLEDIQRKCVNEFVITGDPGDFCFDKTYVTEQYIGLEHVCLVPYCQLSPPLFCKPYCGTDYPFRALPGHYPEGCCPFIAILLNTGIEPFGVFPDNHDIKPVSLHRAQVCKKIESFSYPEHHALVILHGWRSNCPEQDCISPF